MRLWTLRVLLSLLCVSHTTYAQISIQEVCPSNIDTILDEDGDSSDWIELWNHGVTSVDLKGWHLSDDVDDVRKWTLPDLTIAPDERLLVWASGKGSNYPIRPRYHPLVTQGDIGSYFIGTQEPPADWHDVSFDDSSWNTGPSGFGYGDGDDATNTQGRSVYIRYEFVLESKFARYLDGLFFHLDFDDGYVAHLNGNEIARENVAGAPGSHVPSTAYASASHEALLYQGFKLEGRSLAPISQHVRPGDNVLAIQVHNFSSTSSDLTLIPFLTATKYALDGEFPHPSLIFKDRSVNYPLHTTFRLSADGEELVLTNAQIQVIDQIDLPKVFANTSFGPSEASGASAEPLHFLEPTPGAANTTEGRPGYAPAVSANPGGQMTTTTTSVTLSTEDPSLEIRYTTDCTEPNALDLLVTGPIVILDSTPKVTVVRARAFQDGLWPGPISTDSYLVNVGPVGELPVFSLVTEPDNFWDWETGIHVLGPNAGSAPWYIGANFWNDWEKPLHAEFFETDGEREVSMDLGTKIHGNYSRTHAQKSLRLIARGGYGGDVIRHPFFDDVATDEFKVLLLRNSGNDFLNGNCRDPLVHLASAGTDIDDMAYRPTLVYVNGEYWGFMGIRERNDENYLANHHDVDSDRVDILEFGGNAVEGTSAHYEEMLSYAVQNDLADDAHFAVVASMMDTHNYAKYIAHQVWACNTDWPQNNIKFWRPQRSDGMWRWLLYDTDFGLGYWGGPHTTNSLSRLFNPNEWYTQLFVQLMDNQGFQEEFILVYTDLLNTAQSPTVLLPVVDGVEGALIQDMPNHLSQWGGNYNTWQNHMSNIRTFIANRVPYCRSHIRSQFNLSGDYTLGLNVQPPGSGHIELTAIDVDSPFTGVYFLGVPMSLKAVPNSGYSFSGWAVPPPFSGSVPQTQEIVIEPTNDFSLEALFTPTGAGDNVVLNELQYNPSRGADSEDWVELHNMSLSPISLDGWELRDESGAFVIPSGTTISGAGHLVLCRDLAAFTAEFPAVTNVVGDFGFGLSGGGERIELHNSGGLHDFVEYDDSLPWPTGPDGGGSTLELIDAGTDNALAGSWAESNVFGGTPGEKNSVSP